MAKSILLLVLKDPSWPQVGILRKWQSLCHNTYVPNTTWFCHFEAVWFQMYIRTTKAFNNSRICLSNHLRLTNWNSFIRLLSLLVEIQHQIWFITKIGGEFLLAVLLRLALVEESQNHVALLLSELYKEDWILITHKPQQQQATVQSN